MPVHAVSGGYRWGNSGKTYPTKRQAEAQARAIYASGWREDRTAKGRRTRRELALLFRASRKAEARYVRDLVAILRGVHRGVEKLVMEQHHPAHPDLRKDATKIPGDLDDRIAKHLRDRVGVAFDRMAYDVDKSGARAAKLLGISPSAIGLQGVVSNARNENIRLVEKAGRTYAQDVRRVFSDPKNEGLRVEELRDLLLERGNVSVSRATLVARDQTLKLNAALNEHRQTASGVARYTWSTSNDERVRPMHRELDGQEFDWDDPPTTNEEGDTNHPGEDYQCRCIAIPVIGGDEDLPDDEPAGPEGGDEDLGGVDLPGEAANETEPIEAPEPEPEPLPEPEPAEPEPRQVLREMFRNGVDIAARAGATAEDVLGGFDHPGIADWLERDELNRPDLHVASSIKVRKAAGAYWAMPRGTQATETGRAFRPKIAIQTRLKPLTEADYAKAWGEIWTVGQRGESIKNAEGFTKGIRPPTKRERMQATLRHEFGHHVHLGPHSLNAGVDEVVTKAWRDVGLDDWKKRGAAMRGTGPNPAISRYAAQDSREYFAENFAAYVSHPKDLEAHDPVGFKMVRDVLEKLGIEKPKAAKG